jgi:hypothetical protein
VANRVGRGDLRIRISFHKRGYGAYLGYLQINREFRFLFRYQLPYNDKAINLWQNVSVGPLGSISF